MKRVFIKVFGVLILIIVIMLSKINSLNVEAEVKDFRSVGYFYQENGDIMNIDVTQITHLNYSFGLIYHNEEGNKQNVPRDIDKLNTIYLPDKVKSDLELLPKLREKNPNLKVLLAVGGWECRGFSGLASTSEGREQFANSCLDLINKYNLEGIDIDWEYPVNGAWGVIDAKPEDKTNYTLLLKAIRDKIGPNKLLTIAGAANKKFLTAWTEFDKIIQLVDYINIMAYDLSYGSCYMDSGLFESEEFKTSIDGDNYTVDKIVKNYLNAGANSEILNLGIPFYARIPRIAVEGIRATMPPLFKSGELTDYLIQAGAVDSNYKDDTGINYNKLVKYMINKNGFTRKWDDKSKSPYLTHKDSNGVEQFAITYEDEESITYKAKYIKDNNLGGAMFWEFTSDYENTLVSKLGKELLVGNSIETTPKEDVNDKTNVGQDIKTDEEPKVKEGNKKITLVFGMLVISVLLIGVVLRKSTHKNK